MTSTEKPKNGTSPSKQQVQKNVPDQPDTDKAGQEKGKPLTLGRTEKLLKKHGLELTKDEPGKRIYRKNRDQLTDPDKDPQASVNRISKQLSPRIYPEHIELFNRCSENFPSKRAALERAIELLAVDLDI